MDDLKLFYLQAFDIIENTILLYGEGSNKPLADIPLSDFLRDVRSARCMAVYLTNNTK